VSRSWSDGPEGAYDSGMGRFGRGSTVVLAIHISLCSSLVPAGPSVEEILRAPVDGSSIELLKEALGSSEPDERIAAAYSLGRHPPERGYPLLLELVRRVPEPVALDCPPLGCSVFALGSLQLWSAGGETVHTSLTASRLRRDGLRRVVLDALQRWAGLPGGWDVVLWEDRFESGLAGETTVGEKVSEALRLLSEPNWSSQLEGLRFLGESEPLLEHPELSVRVRALLESERPIVRGWAIHVGVRSDVLGEVDLVGILATDDRATWTIALDALVGRVGAGALERLLRDHFCRTREVLGWDGWPLFPPTATASLQSRKPEDVFEALSDLLDDPNCTASDAGSTCTCAVALLDNNRDPRAPDRLLKLFQEAASSELRVLSARLLAERGETRCIEAFRSALLAPDWHVRSAAAWALGRLGARAAASQLARLVEHDGRYRVRESALYAIGAIVAEGPLQTDVVPTLLQVIDRRESATMAVGILADLGDRRACLPFLELVGNHHRPAWIRTGAALRLPLVCEPDMAGAIRELLDDEPSSHVRDSLRRALEQLKSAELGTSEK